MKRLLSVAVLAVLAPSFGCSPAQRQAVGGTVMALGAATTVTGSLMLSDPCTNSEYHRGLCADPAEPPPYEREGAQLVVVGLGTLVLGGIIYLTTKPLPHPKRGEWHFTQAAPGPR